MLDNRTAERRSIKTSLADLTNNDALAIGRSLSQALRDRKTADAGVDLWRLQFPSLTELCKKNNGFFIKMSLVIARRKLIEAPWGLLLRVSLGAAISTIDIATDVYALYQFFSEGEYFFAYSMIGMSSTSVLIQSLLGEKRKRQLHALLKNIFS